jgi:glycosyltransferase involved in cell wall biosynthesis
LPPLISVVIATHNRLDLLPETIASVRVQTYPSVEVVVVDDASSDDTPAWVAQQHDVVSVRSDENIERSKARNLGISHARGDYILVLDDDDIILPHALQTLHDALASDAEAVAVTAGYTKFDGHGNEVRAPHPRRRRRRVLWRDFMMGWFAHHGRTLFRAQALRAVGGYGIDPPHEDRELWLKVSRLGPVVVLPDRLMRYRLHAGMSKDDPWSTLEAVLRDHAAQLNGAERDRAERYIRAAALTNRAHRSYDADAYAGTLRDAASAVRAAPDVLTSFMASGLVADTVKAAAGIVLRPSGMAKVRGGLGKLRRVAKRDPWAARQAGRDQSSSG